MQRDGNLVVYPAGKSAGALWHTHTNGHYGAYARFQKDGNLVVYPAGKSTGALWHSHTYGLGGNVLRLQNDSNLVVYAGGRALWSWATEARYDRMLAGQTLAAGQRLSSPDRAIDLVMQADGNLVLYNAGTSTNALWNSQTDGHPGAYAKMQPDGNFVVYDKAGRALWHTETYGFGGSWIRLQDDKNLVVYRSRQPLWSRLQGEIFDQLRVGWTLDPGDRLTSSNHSYDLAMQADGNLVVYPSGRTTGALWSTQSGGHPGSHAVMQADGNLVVYDSGGSATWNSGTAGHSGVRLVMQSDGNLVAYQGATALWSRITGVISTQPPIADSVARAQSWVDSRVPYSQTSYYTNSFGTYRQDCSGYVSMAWQLGTSRTTNTLPQVSHQISKDELRAGDILLATTTHVVLFDRWTDASHTKYWGYEEIDYGRVAEHRVIPYPYWSGYGTYIPYRKN